MRITNQAILLNMYQHEGIYEKTVDGYQIQFVAKCHLEKKRRLPCIIFMVSRTIEPDEQHYLKLMVNQRFFQMHFQDTDVKNDTLCLHAKINNKTIDKVMHGIYQVITTFMKLNVMPTDEKTYHKYRFSFCDDDTEKQLIVDI